MGNSRSQQPSKSLCLLQLIRRSWKIVSSAGDRHPDDIDDCVTDLSTASRCSGCKGCGYHQELNFDSESDMAPNAEEDLLVTMPRNGPHSSKERLRPPTYNAEDYAMALRRWGRRTLGSHHQAAGNDNQQNTLPSTCTSSSSGYASGNAGEMTLRQFTSVSELLNKLRADLRLAFPSFVQEFSSPPAEGISLLLETLRGIQLSQSTPPSALGQTGPRRPRARRAALDELGCIECLNACVERCPDAVRILAQAQPGLLALTVCLTSGLNRSRIIALQLLTKVCQTTGGHGAVSEAVSTLRLRYGEGGRFRFLAGALLAAKAALPLRVAGVSFLNAFLSSAPRSQTKLYIQAEACEAGLEPRALQEWLKYVDDEDPLTELLREEVRKWSRHCVDVDALQGRARRAEETCRVLSKKVSALQRQLQKLQLERLNEYNNSKNRQQQGTNTATNHTDAQRDEGQAKPRLETEKKLSSSAEDEGISFSERSSSPEDQQANRLTSTNGVDNDQETTIDDVIEELRIIVKDAEEELHDWNQLQDTNPKIQKSEFGKTITVGQSAKSKNQAPSKARECLRSTEESARMDRVLKTNESLKILVPGPQSQNRDINANEEEDKESAIVPAIIHPQPPRRAPPCLVGSSLFIQQHRNPATCDLTVDQDIDPHRVIEVCVESEHDEDLLLLDDDGSDSLLSASRLQYYGGVTSPKLPIVDRNNHNDELDGLYRRRRSLGSNEFKMESLADFEISETILDERIPRKRMENNNNHNSNSLGSKQYSKCTNTVQRRTERRKYLRRCQSQDQIDPHDSCSLKSRGSGRGVLEHIRKFESLNSFDDRKSLPNFDNSSRLRRSESFHQTRLSSFSKDYCSSRGGSDSGLMYNAVDNDSNSGSKQNQQNPQRSITKSLDRIDEGLDSMVDIVVTKERRQLCRRLSNDDRPAKQSKHQSRERQRSDYEDFKQKYRSYHDENKVEMSDDRKYTSFLDTRKDRNEYAERSLSSNRQQNDSSRIFAGRPHDVLGFGKNRFNAGKYSGNSHSSAQQPPPQFVTKNVHRHINVSSSHHSRGKVTDMVSGLY